MSINSFSPVPVPLGDGTGAPVSIVGQGLKTFVIGGVFDATVIIEIGILGQFAPIFILDKPSQFRDVAVVAEEIRVKVVNHRSGQAIVFVGGNPAVNQFGAMDVPVGNGIGVPLDTSIFGVDKTILVGAVFEADLAFEVSEDIGGPWAVVGKIDKSENFISLPVVSRFIRVVVTNFRFGLAIVNVGAADMGGVDTDRLVGVTVNDTTPDFLAAKTVAGAGIGLAIVNPGANEQLQITNTTPDELVGVTANDLNPNFLAAKAVAGPGIIATILNPAANEGLQFSTIFGRDYQTAANAARLTTAGAMFVTHSTLITPALTGTYRIYARALVDSAANMQCQLENLTDGGQIGGRSEYSPLLSSDRILWSTEDLIVFAGVSKTFAVQFRDDPPPGATAGMSFSFIEFFRVA
jgi:hypothetical protein